MVETFRSLSIDMVEVEDQEVKDIRLPSFPCGQTLNNLTSIKLLVVFRFHNEYPNNEHENDSVNGQRVDFERVVYASETGTEEYMENDDLPLDLLRLVE